VRRLVLLALLGGCAEAPADGADAGRADGGAGDAGRPAGAACASDADCRGACLADDADPGGGRRCFDRCAAPDECPAGTACAGGVCRARPVAPADEGDACDVVACRPGLVCAAAHPEGPRCARPCAGDGECAPGERCGSDPRVCLPGGAAAFQCPATPCRVPSLVCVPDEAGTGRCVALCGRVGEACPEGGTCAEGGPDGALACLPAGDRALGESCLSGGDAACAAGLTCVARGPGDAEGFCSRPCEGPCDDAFACRAPWPGAAAVCLPLANGAGDGQGTPGAACDAHGHTDCRGDLFCAPGIAGRAVCASPCADGACAEGFVCARRGEDAWCLRGTPDGDVGTPCEADGDCRERCRTELPAGQRYCTAACAPGGCPQGFRCAGGACEPGAEERRPLGAPCADAGAGACASGLCFGAGRPEEAVCSQRCGDESPCPAPLRCVALDTGRFCLP
jgi:hypothetical protein